MKLTRSLRVILAIRVTSLIFVLGLLIFSVFLLRQSTQTRREVLEQSKNSAELSVLPLVRAYSTYSTSIGLKLTSNIRPIAQRLTHIEYFQIVVPATGEIVYDSRTLKRTLPKETITDSGTLRLLQSRKATDELINGQPVYYFPYINEAGGHEYSLRYFVGLHEVRDKVTGSLTQFILALMIALPTIYFFTLWLVHKHVVTPIDQLRADTNIAAGGKITHKISAKTQDEFNLLSQNIDHMADDLTQRVQELEEEKAWKDEFIVLASHNLRTPLTIVLSAASSLEREPNLSTDGKKFVELIKLRGKELHNLVENLLSISTLKGGKMQLTHAPFDLLQVISQIAKSHETRLAEKKQTIQVDIPGQQLIIDGNEGQIFQVIDNLVDNAIKFTPEGGTITVSVAERSSFVHITVSDTGEGISEKMIHKLFQSFRRGSEPFSVENRGSGIGLYFVKLAVEAHGGEVSIKSNKGKGTEVTIQLPKHAKPIKA